MTNAPNPMTLLDASCRVALAAYLHDLGKFAERADTALLSREQSSHSTEKTLANHQREQMVLEAQQHYCKKHEVNGKIWYSHKHAAYTALVFDQIEQFAPNFVTGDTYPFTSREQLKSTDAGAPDSLVNAAAMHHVPETFLQWIIATADRVASGFERDEFEKYNASEDKTELGKNHYQARQLTLFEQIAVDDKKPLRRDNFLWRYPLMALSPQAIFPVKAQICEPSDDSTAKEEYAQLWKQFLTSLTAIPQSHRSQIDLWLDHFDSLWLSFTHSIPAATAFNIRPEVSLYDHSKTTAALAVALWRWHEANKKTDLLAAKQLKDRDDYAENKFLLIQGDFFGIQDFVFADGSQTNKHAAKLLRGRSFYVSLLSELAALKVLQELELPTTSQVINAAGKFLIVAPNTDECRQKLISVRAQLNEWFITQTYGQAGIGLAWTEACCDDFISNIKNSENRFNQLLKRLFDALEVSKLQRFDLALTHHDFPDADFSLGVCDYNGKLPANQNENNKKSCAISRDQILIGESIVKYDRLLVLADESANSLHQGQSLKILEQSIFGYCIAFTKDADQTGQFGQLARQAQLIRAWDYSAPEDSTSPVWHGYARRYISGYIPTFDEHTQWESEKYMNVEVPNSSDNNSSDRIKTFNHIACEDRSNQDNPEEWLGIAALGALKGDIDNLGLIFQSGLDKPSFAKMAALSRQVNAFFTIYLPSLLKSDSNYKDIYTVFAGGDDFFLIGPWLTTQRLAVRLAQDFKKYVAENSEIHFSAGIATQSPKTPVKTLAEAADSALELSKKGEKNALTCYGITRKWEEWPKLANAAERLEQLRFDYQLSTGYIYGLLQLGDMAQSNKPEDAIWRSRFHYRTQRFVIEKLPEAQRAPAKTQLLKDIGEIGLNKEGLGHAYKIVLFNHLYQRRER